MLAGKSNYAIAAELGMAEVSVRRDRKRIYELWSEQVGGEIVKRRLVRIAELDALKEEALKIARDHEKMGRAVLFGETVDGKIIRIGEKSNPEFKGQTAQLLEVARKAIVDAAEIEGLKEQAGAMGGITRIYIGVDVNNA